MPQHLDALLTTFESTKSRYGQSAAAETKRLINQLETQAFDDPKSLLRFHEALLFLRAFPHSKSLIPKLEKLLNSFHARIEKLPNARDAFDDFDTSGIAGTTMQDTLNFEAARWLARRIPQNVEIAWEEYEEERAMGSTWPRFIPLLEEDADVEANIPWRRWLDAARGRERDLEFLIRQFEQLPTTPRACAELYDSLRLPLRWHLNNLKLSRTRNWTSPNKFFIHTDPLLTRKDVSLAHELAKPAPRLTKLSRREADKIMQLIREVMVVRYRELYGTTLGDPASVVRTNLGSAAEARGVTIYLWNLPPARRLPLRAYVAGFTLKNGVPINYIEAIGLCEWIEVGFNTFYTYRHGETAWIYAQALRALSAFTRATTISVYPYQIGQNNDEALDSGAFWFYRKLGFRSGNPALEKLARREEQKIAANSTYRTSKKTLKRLAEAHVFYEPDETARENSFTSNAAESGQYSSSSVRAKSVAYAAVQAKSVTNAAIRTKTVAHAAMRAETVAYAAVEERPFKGRVTAPPRRTGFSPRGRLCTGPWDTFSTRTLALRVNRRMAQKFKGDSTTIRESSMKQIARVLRINVSSWTPAERRTLETWSLVLALIPNLQTWSAKEKRELITIIRAQAAPNEMRYLHLTQQHPRLRREILRLGS